MWLIEDTIKIIDDKIIQEMELIKKTDKKKIKLEMCDLILNIVLSEMLFHNIKLN